MSVIYILAAKWLPSWTWDDTVRALTGWPSVSLL